MRLLILGGTSWLGRTAAEEALAGGHEVVCLARGKSGDVARGARLVRADRDQAGAYAAVQGGQHWDAVVDVATQPGQVRGASAALAPSTGHYIYVSSISVYANHRDPDQDESAPLLEPLQADGMQNPEQYGQAKVACERAVVESMGSQRSLVVRPGLIGGPGDRSGRSGYWPWRFARPTGADGAVLVPDAPDLPTALVDVRDLGRWLVKCAEDQRVGTLNATANRMPLGEHLGLARSVSGQRSTMVQVPESWLEAQGVKNWAGTRSLPLWVSDPDWRGINARSPASAAAAGLAPRPLETTLADTLAWELDRPEPGPHGAGLTDQEERDLLAAWRNAAP